MQEKLHKNFYYLSWLAICILSIVLFRLVKLYDIFCAVLSVASPIIFGYIFAWILKPTFTKMSKKIGGKFSLVILITIMLCLYGLLVWYLLPIVMNNVGNLLNVIENFIDKLSNLPFFDGLKGRFSPDVDALLESCNNLISFLGIFALIHIFGFYLLYNFDVVNGHLRHLIPVKYRRITLEYVRKMSLNMRLYIKGTLIDTTILFVISSVLYTIIDLKYAIFLAVLSAVTNIIPFIGPYIGGIPAVLVGLSVSTELGVATLVCVILAQTVESNIINPLIMAKCIKVNPLFIVIALTIMGKFAGLLGMVFAVPSVIILKITCEFLQKYKEKRNAIKEQ